MGNPEATADMHRAVVFDMDGVLVHSEHLWERMWARFAEAHGRSWTAAQTRRVQGMSAPEWAAFLAEFSGTTESAERTEQLVVDDMVAALDTGEIRLLDGAGRMVSDVARRAPIALASSAPRRLIDAVLTGHDLARLFTATVSSAEVPRGKPSPDVYLAAADKLGERPDRCLAVEDSSNGLRAAAAAGMTVIALPNPDYAPAGDALARAAHVAADQEEVRRLLTKYLPEPVGY
ncbi:HAD family hydrolase [Saccharomonospora iraqiensis]|uniref:HAD family hydrolase n=1 Tax=Saccharomonospora iraqiensis TaxID=52698 RepID=UPI0004099351|nr:HAD family phosphatase [Saccharomonospora iraqiensis]